MSAAPESSSVSQQTSKVETRCTPDAMESNTGLFAYLFELYQKAISLEARGKAGSKIALSTRRPDLLDLQLDKETLTTQLSPLALVIGILTKKVQEDASIKHGVHELLAGNFPRADLPYHLAHQQIHTVLKKKNCPSLELWQSIKYAPPSFCFAKLYTESTRSSMRIASGLNPELQRQLLLSPSMSVAEAKQRFGEFDIGDTFHWQRLTLSTIEKQTGVAPEEIAEVLAISNISDSITYNVKCSAAYTSPTAPSADSRVYGASYLHENTPTCIDLRKNEAGTLRLGNINPAELGRIYQIIKLQRALKLPFSEVDSLLMAIVHAEGNAKKHHITTNTLRAIGLFRYLNEAYKVTTDQFAALIYLVSPYSGLQQTPMLDSVLAGRLSAPYDLAALLTIDDRILDLDDPNDNSADLIVAQLSKALGNDEKTTRRLLSIAKRELKLKNLKLSLPLISSLYRLSHIPRLLKRSQAEGAALIEILNTVNTQALSQLAGAPTIHEDTGAPDVLDVLLALTNLDKWLRQHNIAPSAILPIIKEEPLPHPLFGSAHHAIFQNCLTGLRSLPNDATMQAKEDLLGQLLLTLLGNRFIGSGLTSAHILPLLRWSKATPDGLLQDILLAGQLKGADQEHIDVQRLASADWHRVMRYAHAVQLFRLSASSIEALYNLPDAFELADTEQDESDTPTDDKNTPLIPTLDLDACYKLSRFSDWVSLCCKNGFNEIDAIDYLTRTQHTTNTKEVQRTAMHMSHLLGWNHDEMLLATPWLKVSNAPAGGKTLDHFLSTLTPDELKLFETKSYILSYYKNRWKNGCLEKPTQNLTQKIHEFMTAQPGPLLVTRTQMDTYGDLERWRRINKHTAEQLARQHNENLELKVQETTNNQYSYLNCTASTIVDIDYAMRLQTATGLTGLPCESLLNLRELDESSSYEDYQRSADLLMAGCDNGMQVDIENELQPSLRDALASYLIAHGKLGEAHGSTPDREKLSQYFLTDIWCSHGMTTTRIAHAISSFQQFIHQVLAQLEPGHESNKQAAKDSLEWNQGLNHYQRWRALKSRDNHPENLVSPGGNPRKSRLFQELEIDINNGRLDESALGSAVCSYISKFERLCNLRVVSGFLDGHSAEQSTYHLIGKTNASPSEYYWRSVDMGLHDSAGNISPLAWSEWERINFTPSSQLTQTALRISEKDGQGNEIGEIIQTDNIRPLMLAGRKYVFWVERQVTEATGPQPGASQTEKEERLAINYIFLQADNTWSTTDEFMVVTPEQLRTVSAANKTALDIEKFQPGLIVTVIDEGGRAKDPWLVAILYHAAEEATGSNGQSIHFAQYTDLLFSNKTAPPASKNLEKTLLDCYGDPRVVQGPFDGRYKFCSVSNYKDAGTLSDASKKTFIERFSVGNVMAFSIKPRITADDKLDIEVIYAHELREKLTLKNGSEPKRNIELLQQNDDKTETSLITLATPHGTPPRVTHTFASPSSVKLIARYYVDDLLLDETICDVAVTEAKYDNRWHVDIREHDQTQYLDKIDYDNNQPSKPLPRVRLNTLLGKQLAQRANLGFEMVLDWSTQNLLQESLDWESKGAKQHLGLEISSPMDLYGANGLYLHELYLHLPFLIASRLTEQGQYREAEHWYFNYLFHPWLKSSQSDERPAPWRTRPLCQEAKYTADINRQQSTDPVINAFIEMENHQASIILSVIESWQLEGDHHYRQMTTSDLSHAQRCYNQASSLLERYYGQPIWASCWSPVKLPACSTTMFHKPLNPRVASIRDTLASRMFNLRHGLSLNGKKLPNIEGSNVGFNNYMPHSLGINILPAPMASTPPPAPAYRFRKLLPAARSAAQQLQDLGRYYLHLMEVDTDNQLDVLLLRQAMKLSDLSVRLGNESINALRAQQQTLQASRRLALHRHDYYGQLIEEGLSANEAFASTLGIAAAKLKTCAALFALPEGAAKLLPNIFGLADGGMDYSGAFGAAKEASELGADAAAITSDQLSIQAAFERRDQEWRYEQRQAELDLEIIDKEFAELDIELKAASISLAGATQERENLDETYAFATSGFIIVPVYQWLVGRQEFIYGAAYNAVLSLCQATQAAWRYEIGDNTRADFIKTSGWSESYKGMLAGESLLVDLQEMENAFLAANERRLTIKKTISLKTLLGNKWAKALAKLSAGKIIDFELKTQHFDSNYPGHYQRQIRHLSVSFLAHHEKSLGTPSGILTQTANTLLTRMDHDALKYFYGSSKTLPASVTRNVRAEQSMALSSLTQDDGLGYTPGQWVYESMVHDERYLPFEGTGALSRWALQLPDTQFSASLTESLDDIHLNLIYTAKPGDAEFIKAVNSLRAEDKNTYDTEPAAPASKSKEKSEVPKSTEIPSERVT
ncbi:Tc toxin subunit A-related protein [Pseudomonas soli]|uniref:Tc toxin subunit A-related protein n=1 Tax=Pseudomonas soli TaxID=1306993 RepID=UPI0037FBB403